jgi:succinyl-diaminopimelate desuccinylase
MPKLTPTQELTRDLICCPSVTPTEGGALVLLEERLTKAGFTCYRLPFGEGDGQVDNLFAVYGSGGAHFCFAGHTDVVPPGTLSAWRHDPFSGVVEDGCIFGRGAVDMKGAIAAFTSASLDWLTANAAGFNGRISLLITGDEEGKAIHGTKPVLDWLKGKEMMPDAFLVGEPTNPDAIGDTIKNGRRGSLSCEIKVTGMRGHVAYPEHTVNPILQLMAMLTPLMDGVIDEGNADFDPSTAAITSFTASNPVRNVTPSHAAARFNIRYSSEHSGDSLKAWLTDHFNTINGNNWTAKWFSSADPFITSPGAYTDLVMAAVHDVTGRVPQLSTSGGTSDARFIAPYADVVEFGLVGQTMHQVDEHTALDDLETLRRIYYAVLTRFFDTDRFGTHGFGTHR